MKKFLTHQRLLVALSSMWLIVFLVAFVMTRPASADDASSRNLPNLDVMRENVSIGNCAVFPTNNIWNTRIDSLDPHPNSDNFVNRIGASAGLHPDFGTEWNNAPNSIPYIVVPTNQPLAAITLTPYGNEADPGPYPIPTNAPIEGGSNSTGDRHVLIVREGDCKLFELFRAFPNANGSWKAYGASFDLNSNALRPADWTSADAAGLPIMPGLVKYEEVQQALNGDGVIHHALRFTVPQTYYGYVWPARHRTDTSNDPNDPLMGLRFRLKSNFNISGFSPSNQVILRTLKQYGMFVADNGGAFYLSGAPNANWNDDDLHELQNNAHGYDFEAVDESALMVNPDSGQAQQGGVNTPTPTRTHTPTPTFLPTWTPEPCVGAPAVPSLVDPSNKAAFINRKVGLKWTGVACATQYKVLVRQDSKNGVDWVNKSVASLSLTLKKLPRNHRYYWRVQACAESLCSASTRWRNFYVNP